ncbi:MAG: glycoside hydrolase family 6 protein [Solirubrobacterales bacterium]
MRNPLGQLAATVLAVGAGSLLALSLGACGAGSAQSAASPALAPATQSALRHGADPLAGQAFYVAPNSPAAVEARRLQAQGDAHDAQLLGRIAAEPTATWFADSSPQVQARASALLTAAAAQTPVIVAYDVPQRDCAGGYSAGGAPTPAAYGEWVARLAAGLGAHPAVVILEPDAVPDALSGCLSPAAARARLGLLSQAVGILRRDPRAAVYIDAGNANWIKQPRRLADALSGAGIARAAGFALNVANFQSTRASVAYGERLSHLLHGAHFVIDTGRNGNGPDTNPADAPGWCNPPGRALGRAPSTSTGEPRVDAYLWVKAPGESDGSCRPGAPPAGQWWPQYALQLAAATP